MATVELKFNCGCGFVATTVAEAQAHADDAGHQLSVIGRVLPPQKVSAPGNGGA